MKNLTIKKLRTPAVAAADIPGLLDQEQIPFQVLNCVNWEEFPYRPQVRFRLVHTGKVFLLNFRVHEETLRARYAEDNGDVWKDSCVEFFLSPAGDKVYYNLECNCAGTLLIGAGSTRQGRMRAPVEITSRVDRWCSLGREPFQERPDTGGWEVALLIPVEAFFQHRISSLSGRQIRANFYKCGDELKTPHFVSWNPIHTPKPDFHRPEFFGNLELE
ncbi:MAG: hypothetical protein LUF04_14050 [Bacteroides sp.]|nr:hypothetical protein [Bacteroides sp.]